MPSILRQYDPGKVTISFAGATISGYADGTFVKAERAQESFKTYVGADGEACRVRMRDQSGTITITLSQSSPSNDFLAAKANADEVDGSGYGPVLVKDLNGNTLVSSPVGWIQKHAPVEYGKDVVAREWVIAVGLLNMQAGGASPLQP